MSPGRVAVHGRTATQVANSAAPRRSPSPATTPISRSWAAPTARGVQAVAVRAVLDAAAATGLSRAVISGARVGGNNERGKRERLTRRSKPSKKPTHHEERDRSPSEGNTDRDIARHNAAGAYEEDDLAADGSES